MKKKIVVVSGSRAEYGLLCPLMKRIKADDKFLLKIIATGMHLSPEFGLTFKEIEADGFRIDHKVKMPLSSDSSYGISKSISEGIIGFARVYKEIAPDLVVVLGDRFEIFSAVVPAYMARIPIAHIHGGEITSGSLDDAIRHSITKMSLLHFASTDEYRRRIIQLGEEPSMVFNVGSLGVENIHKLKLLTKSELESQLQLRFLKRNILVTFHPANLEIKEPVYQFSQLLHALDNFKDINVIFTKSNADIGGLKINRLIDKYVSRSKGRAVSFVSLGHKKYLSLVNQVDAVVGNSSSGIIETPSFGKPTVNIGLRQDGRAKASSVINCRAEKDDIIKALKKAMSVGFREHCRSAVNPYDKASTSLSIYKAIKKHIHKLSPKKRFFDVGIKKFQL